ncbi:hypothetical protein GCM10023322_70250 [Rugosimonospora acidiphila]|uniref:DUF3263 domain-containing protein n=1 Tax=Rugosimonospora acidiphila TaxID=556531 RepID=A0ABP9SMN7_9ACTN
MGVDDHESAGEPGDVEEFDGDITDGDITDGDITDDDVTDDDRTDDDVADADDLGDDESDEPGDPDQLATFRVPEQRSAPDAVDSLTERELAMLAFERRWWRHAGSKEQAIRDQFGVSSTRYYQLLNALLDRPAALAHDPVLVKRLRRLRATRTRARSGGRTS